MSKIIDKMWSQIKSAIKSFKKAGFIRADLEEKVLVFGEEIVARQLLITKEMYFSKN